MTAARYAIPVGASACGAPIPAGPQTAQQIADAINAGSPTCSASLTPRGEVRVVPLSRGPLRGGHSRAVAECASRGLTSARRRHLEWLADHPHTSLDECAAAFGIGRAGVHYHRVALASLGLVDRITDARASRITPAGWAALGRCPTCPTCLRPLPTGDTSP